MLTNRVHTFIQTHALIAPNDSVIIAVSGGADSLSLLHILTTLRDSLAIQLHVAHFDHQLRGADSTADARFVEDTARVWGIPVTLQSHDVAAYAQEQRQNLHQAARELRYRFLAQLATSVGAQAVAVAHTANDQAETVLMSLLRGAGPNGLRGMRPNTPWAEWSGVAHTHPNEAPRLIRPLLDIQRAEIETYCAEQHLVARHDHTNEDLRYTRNRIRHALLPQLIEYNPHIVAALNRTAAICAEDFAFLQDALAATWPTLTTSTEDGTTFRGAIWRSIHPALQREALRKAHALLAPDDTLSWEHVEQARTLVTQGVGKQLELPSKVTLTVRYDGDFTVGATTEEGPQLDAILLELPESGSVTLDAGWKLEVEPNVIAARPAHRWEVYLNPDSIQGPLVARRRRPGDRMRPAGARGSKRLQDLFVDAKVPRGLRNRWPIIATDQDIVWVTGVRAAEGFVAPPGTPQAIRISLIQTNVDNVGKLFRF
jgi:tRNA(Ile)-lysidine synthetase-like protein